MGEWGQEIAIFDDLQYCSEIKYKDITNFLCREVRKKMKIGMVVMIGDVVILVMPVIAVMEEIAVMVEIVVMPVMLVMEAMLVIVGMMEENNYDKPKLGN